MELIINFSAKSDDNYYKLRIASIFNGLSVMKVDVIFMYKIIYHLDLSESGAIQNDRWIAERRFICQFQVLAVLWVASIITATE